MAINHDSVDAYCAVCGVTVKAHIITSSVSHTQRTQCSECGKTLTEIEIDGTSAPRGKP